jgi:hypothetical protein
MRQFMIAAAMALGLIGLWAAILPLTAQPAPAQTALASTAMAKALFLCRGANGIDRTCAAALAKALVSDTSDNSMSRASDRVCRMDREMLARLD